MNKKIIISALAAIGIIAITATIAFNKNNETPEAGSAADSRQNNIIETAP